MRSDWNYPEPCMCGAIDCPSCGPAQGYSREYAEPEEDEIDDDPRKDDDALYQRWCER